MKILELDIVKKTFHERADIHLYENDRHHRILYHLIVSFMQQCMPIFYRICSPIKFVGYLNVIAIGLCAMLLNSIMKHLYTEFETLLISNLIKQIVLNISTA